MTNKSFDKAAIIAELTKIVGEHNLLMDEPMSEHTTFKIGGPAEFYVVPETKEAVLAVLEFCKEADVNCFVLGCGSDLLVSDAGIDGVVLAVGDGLGDIQVFGNTMICDAGVTLHDAAEIACELSLSGLEFACGIPGSVGGACFMNAGAYGGCIADVLASVEVATPTGEVLELSVDELNLGYRQSRIADEGLVVLSATFELTPAKQADIRATMDDLTAQRESKQPLELPSAGSTFKRPEGYFAGKLISDAGLQGARVGGAEVSRKHAGFVVNVDHATAADVQELIAHVQAEVKRQFDVSLEPEVRFVGK